ncbi:MAG: PDDEXK nuclease domain-containing protein [Polyangiales bacterium]
MGKKAPPKTSVPAVLPPPAALAPADEALLSDLRTVIEKARGELARAVNSAVVMVNWHVGRRIRSDLLLEARAPYGKQVVALLAERLTAIYGAGFSRPQLFHMIRFAEVFPQEEIVSTASRQLGWSHFLEVIYLDDALRRDFYVELCRAERWSVRTLRAKVQSMLFERTALSRKPDELARQEVAKLRETDQLTPDLVFRDPYLLDFLGLADTYSEKDLERAILRELEQFLLEFGDGFAFIGRQKRITIDAEDYYIDLLFYHRGLRRLVAVDLKLGRFQAADKGQMELYLRWLDAHERKPGEEAPLGLILCAGKSDEHVALLRLEETGIRVAEYLTALPAREVLEKKLHDAIRAARERLAAR